MKKKELLKIICNLKPEVPKDITEKSGFENLDRLQESMDISYKQGFSHGYGHCQSDMIDKINEKQLTK